MSEEKVIIGIDGKIVELQGKELEAFETDRENQHKALQAEQEARIAARASALAKLAALGLTEEEIAAL